MMNDGVVIPKDRLERNPLITPDGYRRLMSIAQHPNAPIWNYVVGDRVVEADLPFVEEVRKAVFEDRISFGNSPRQEIVTKILALRERVAIFGDHIPVGADVEKSWARIPTTSREDIAARIDRLVPVDEDLARLIVYDTSGTTGHPIVVPHHPRAVAMNHALVEFALSRHGVAPNFSHDMNACINIAAQRHTVMFANVFAVWKQAGFAKVNLSRHCWRENDSADRFFRDIDPAFVTGDPSAFEEMLRQDIGSKPKALVSTALKLSEDLKMRLVKKYGCAIIDWYSTTETGPIAYSCRDGNGIHLLPTDLHVEVVGKDGAPVADGERGEITITGGRNPYLPLLRYRTGDFGSMKRDTCSCGDPAPRLELIDSREIVMFRASDGFLINPVDVSGALRKFSLIQHKFVQRRDGSCDVVIRPIAGSVDTDTMKQSLAELFGKNFEIRIEIADRPIEPDADGRVRAFVSEM